MLNLTQSPAISGQQSVQRQKAGTERQSSAPRKLNIKAEDSVNVPK